MQGAKISFLQCFALCAALLKKLPCLVLHFCLSLYAVIYAPWALDLLGLLSMLLLMHMCSAHKTHACRFPTLGQYTTWELLMREWKEGIRYSFGNKQTVPLEQLEKDLQEGIQQKSTASFKSEKEPWRRGITDRTAIMDRKIVIYGILKAQQDGHDLKEFMSGQIKRAEDAMKKARTAGVKRPPMLLNQLKRQFELAEDRLTPVQFEEQVLGWKLTAQVKAQAASKQQLPVYPPTGSAEA